MGDFVLGFIAGASAVTAIVTAWNNRAARDVLPPPSTCTRTERHVKLVWSSGRPFDWEQE
jgi:hypothetical protein